jgi:hypothetical protein
MPRYANGLFTLVPGNPVTSGTVIESNWANSTLSDIAVQLNNLITRDGILGPIAPLTFPDGSAASPSITFATQQNMGFFRKAPNVLGVSIGGIEVATFTQDGLVLNKAPIVQQPPLQTADFTADINTRYRIDPQTCTQITLPTPTVVDSWVELYDPFSKWSTYNTTVASTTINSTTQTFICNMAGECLRFIWAGLPTGWEVQTLGGFSQTKKLAVAVPDTLTVFTNITDNVSYVGWNRAVSCWSTGGAMAGPGRSTGKRVFAIQGNSIGYPQAMFCGLVKVSGWSNTVSNWETTTWELMWHQLDSTLYLYRGSNGYQALGTASLDTRAYFEIDPSLGTLRVSTDGTNWVGPIVLPYFEPGAAYAPTVAAPSTSQESITYELLTTAAVLEDAIGPGAIAWDYLV